MIKKKKKKKKKSPQQSKQSLTTNFLLLSLSCIMILNWPQQYYLLLKLHPLEADNLLQCWQITHQGTISVLPTMKLLLFTSSMAKSISYLDLFKVFPWYFAIILKPETKSNKVPNSDFSSQTKPLKVLEYTTLKLTKISWHLKYSTPF